MTVPVIDVTRATLKGDGLQRAAVNCPSTFRVSTKAAGEADLDVTVTGHITHLQSYSSSVPVHLAGNDKKHPESHFLNSFAILDGLY